MQLEERNGSTGAGLSKWEAAIGNLEDARVAFDVLARAVDDAVYLDEDAYSHVAPTAQYTKVIQVFLLCYLPAGSRPGQSSSLLELYPAPSSCSSDI